MNMKRIVFLLLNLGLLMQPGCDHSKPVNTPRPPTQPVEVELHDDVSVLEQVVPRVLDSTGHQIKLATASLGALEVGEVVVFSHSDGIVGRITEKQHDGDSVALTLSPVALTDLFRKARISLDIPIDLGNTLNVQGDLGKRQMKLDTDPGVQDGSVLTHSFDLAPGVNLNGSISYTPSFRFDFLVTDDGELSLFTTGFDNQIGFNLSLDAAAHSGLRYETDLLSFPAAFNYPFEAGNLPMYFQIDVGVPAVIELGAAGTASASFGATFASSVDIEFINPGFDGEADASLHHPLRDAPEFADSVSAKIGVGMRLTASLKCGVPVAGEVSNALAVASIETSVIPHLHLEASSEDWVMHAGVDSRVSCTVLPGSNSLGLTDFSRDFPKTWQQPVFSSSDTVGFDQPWSIFLTPQDSGEFNCEISGEALLIDNDTLFVVANVLRDWEQYLALLRFERSGTLVDAVELAVDSWLNWEEACWGPDGDIILAGNALATPAVARISRNGQVNWIHTYSLSSDANSSSSPSFISVDCDNNRLLLCGTGHMVIADAATGQVLHATSPRIRVDTSGIDSNAVGIIDWVANMNIVNLRGARFTVPAGISAVGSSGVKGGAVPFTVSSDLTSFSGSLIVFEKLEDVGSKKEYVPAYTYATAMGLTPGGDAFMGGYAAWVPSMHFSWIYSSGNFWVFGIGGMMTNPRHITALGGTQAVLTGTMLETDGTPLNQGDYFMRLNGTSYSWATMPKPHNSASTLSGFAFQTWHTDINETTFWAGSVTQNNRKRLSVGTTAPGGRMRTPDGDLMPGTALSGGSYSVIDGRAEPDVSPPPYRLASYRVTWDAVEHSAVVEPIVHGSTTPLTLVLFRP